MVTIKINSPTFLEKIKYAIINYIFEGEHEPMTTINVTNRMRS